MYSGTCHSPNASLPTPALSGSGQGYHLSLGRYLFAPKHPQECYNLSTNIRFFSRLASCPIVALVWFKVRLIVLW